MSIEVIFESFTPLLVKSKGKWLLHYSYIFIIPKCISCVFLLYILRKFFSRHVLAHFRSFSFFFVECPYLLHAYFLEKMLWNQVHSVKISHCGLSRGNNAIDMPQIAAIFAHQIIDLTSD